MRKTKNKVGCLIILFIIFSYSFQIYYLNPITTSNELNNQEKIHNSASVSHSKQWITNPHFISSENWTSTKGGLGDPEDVDAYISGGHANYDVLGKNNTFSLVEKPLIGSNWVAVPNPDFPHGPTSNFTDSEGLKVYHLFDDHDANQNPSVHWDRNITMPVDMSDFIITSASVQVEVNATVDLDVDCDGDTLATDGGASLNQQESYDYVRFYVLISDLSKNKVYEMAYLQPNDLGAGNPPGDDTLSNTYLIPFSEEDLIYFITSVLSTDYFNFTITLGIRIYTADNSNTYDNDEFHELLIKSVNFNFTYQRKINQLTSISWNQEGEKPNDVSSNTVVVTEALLDFKYMINDTWTISSPNSEIRILINDFKHTETVKLSTATTSLQKAKIEGFDITYLIEEDQNINISIQVYIADEFTLNRSIRISVDDIYLNVTYNEIFPDISTNLYLFLENENKTANPVIDIPLGENLNITVKYIDSQTKLHITNATVQLEGKVIGSLNESLTLQQYSIIVNTSDLGIGVKILTVTAQKDIYQTQSIQFFVEVTERETVLELYLDSFQKFDGDTVQLEINETLNVTVKYRDFQTTTHLSNATVDLVGVSKFNETNNQYNVTINAKDLGQGITAFTIFAQLLNYQSQSIQFFVDVIERETDLILFIDGSPKNDGDTIQVEIDDFINVTVYYRDNETKEFLPDASINLVGRGELDETINYYNITINAADLDQGITVLTIFAQLVNYQHQSIQFFVEVIERATKIQLYLNDEEKTLDPVFNLSIGQS
ncbi:MAG: hypothetical protein KAW51_09820, partial [Candidatus Lokiarchaeota archaeon]|nr:hypothetical protein [Candidatus Lokiarchaeota archaeon]